MRVDVRLKEIRRWKREGRRERRERYRVRRRTDRGYVKLPAVEPPRGRSL